MLKRNDTPKRGESFLKNLPYTIQQLKNHIESLFEPWMTWDNCGAYNAKTHDINPTWQIDHIIPHSTTKYTSMDSNEFRECWALSNLRPLDARVNNRDGVKRIRHVK